MKKNKLYLVLSMFIALMLCLNLFAGCGSGTGGSNSDWPYSNTPSQLDQTGIKIRLSNIQLPDLGVNNGTYELWAVLPGQDDIADDSDNVYPIVNNDPEWYSLGKFVVTPNGKIMDPSRTLLYGTSDQTAFPVYGQPMNVDLSKAYRVYLSIEPAGEDYSDPTIGGVIMYGTFSNRVCPMRLYAGNTNNVYIPTQDFASDNVPSMVTLENAGTQGTGIWFKNGAQNYKGLYIPALADGYLKYEAWVRDINTGTYYSLGKFTDPQAAEQLNALTYSTMNPAGSKKYPYPGLEFSQAGQNPGGFVASALNLANGNYRAYITLEPNPDNDTSQPFIFVMESGYPNPQPAVAPYQYLPSTLLGSAFNGGTQPMIRMITEKHKTDSDQFIFLDDIPLTKATLE